MIIITSGTVERRLPDARRLTEQFDYVGTHSIIFTAGYLYYMLSRWAFCYFRFEIDLFFPRV